MSYTPNQRINALANDIQDGASTALGSTTDAAWSLSGNASGIAALKEAALLLNSILTQASNHTLTPYPSGAVILNPSSGNVANATAAVTLTSAASKTAYITGFEITGSGATVGGPVTVTITGTITGTMSYTYVAMAGILLANTPLIVTFPKEIPASATATDIVVSCPALGAGNTNNTAVAHGYRV